MHRNAVRAIIVGLSLTACSAGTPQQASAQDRPPPFRTTELGKFESPWAMTFLPDGQLLVTEKAGRMLLLSADFAARRTVLTIPVHSAGQGSLMDVVPAADFAQSRRIYFSYSGDGAGGSGVVLARGTLSEAGPPCTVAPCTGAANLTGVETLFRARPFVSGDGHYSGRIAFAPDGKSLFFTNGERQKFQPAQDRDKTLGKVLHLTLDGQPAPDNPLAAQRFVPEAWSYGHRNLLGLAFDEGGRLWEVEMGPMGGDEVNLIQPGRNYGWPRASNGSNYDGSDIPDHRPGDGYEPPKVWWNPSISPAGLMIYRGGKFPQWKGDAFIPALSGQALIRVHLSGDSASKADQWAMGNRIRAVQQDKAGAIYVLEDGPGGRLLRLDPL